ncbi:MAG: PTS glucose transporter subunit IIA, partial [Lactobacillus crispatus]|nr:PTS glucose transporter subunit IIA [Lactobacillus crispatus]
VLTVFPSKHAIGLVSENGAEFLIHLGLNTVNLKGKYYDAQVKDGDEIKQGQLLMKFDLDQIEKEGYSMQSPILWTNYKDHKYEITVKAGQNISFEDQIMTVNE